MIHSFLKSANEAGQAKLNRLLSDVTYLQTYLNNINVYEFVREFAPFGLPSLDMLVSHCPPIMSRAYSVSTSPLTDPRNPRLIVRSVEFGGNRYGLATSFLARCKPGDQIPMHPLRGVYEHSNEPIILVAIGSGLAPICSVLEDRKARGTKSICLVIFGTRKQSDCPAIVEYLENIKADAGCTKIAYAFSRDHGDIAHYYVTDALKDNAEIAWQIWQEKKSVLYYCGSNTEVVDGLKTILTDLIVEKMGLESKSADKFCKKHKWYVETC